VAHTDPKLAMAASTGASDQLSSLRGFSKTGSQVAALAIAQGAVFSFPLVFAVVCARNLGPSQYGVISFYTALTAILCTFIEFGFDSIGVREVHSSSRRAHPEQEIWNITLAKLIICLPTCVVTVLLLLATQGTGGASMFYAVALYMVAFALEPGWYLRSLELMRPFMFVAVVSRVSGIALLVSVVSAHEHLVRAMWAYTFVAWASSIVGWLVMLQLGVLGKPRIDVPHLRTLFRSGAAVVLGNLSGSSLTNAGIAVLGTMADPVVTGAANMAVRIRAAAEAALLPLVQVGFVRLSKLAGIDLGAAVGFGRRLFYALMACSVVFAVVIGTYADWLAAIVYGLPAAPEAAVILVRLIALGVPACIASNLFSFLGLPLFRQERAYVLVSLGSVVIFFGLLLSLHRSALGNFGWALLGADLWVVLAAGLCLRNTLKHNGKA
jgi:O-antigen/teichoic acid export membrane protein